MTFRPLADTVKATLDWWGTLPADRRAKLRAGITREREVEVLAAWHKEHPPVRPVRARRKATASAG